jgi:hypothetical protein
VATYSYRLKAQGPHPAWTPAARTHDACPAVQVQRGVRAAPIRIHPARHRHAHDMGGPRRPEGRACRSHSRLPPRREARADPRTRPDTRAPAVILVRPVAGPGFC